MISLIKKVMLRLIPLSIKKQVNNFNLLAKEYGQYKTIRHWNCIDNSGNKIPWYTYPCIEYLNNIDFHNKKVFEYGSGNSSGFWARKSQSILSVEDDEDWYENVLSEAIDNQTIILKEQKKDYVSCLDKKFDVIIIDGKHRLECAKHAIQFVNSGGIIILDNSERKEEKVAAKYIRKNFECLQVDFHGFGPINDYTWTTSIFFSRDCVITPLDDIQPNKPIGST